MESEQQYIKNHPTKNQSYEFDEGTKERNNELDENTKVTKTPWIKTLKHTWICLKIKVKL